MATDLEEAAARELSSPAGEPSGSPAPRKRGRPPGSKTRRQGVEDVTAKPVDVPYVATEQSIAAATALGATLWKLVGMFAGYRALEKDEAKDLGKALDPVLFKYVPQVQNWQAEINLVIVVVGLASITRIPKPEAPEKEPRLERDSDGNWSERRETLP